MAASKRFFASLLLIILLSVPAVAGGSLSATSESQSNPLSNHWVASQNCYRDELNQSDVDYNNCWTDNAGKILTMGAITGDGVDSTRALGFIENHTTPDYFMPEAVINGSIPAPMTTSEISMLSDRIPPTITAYYPGDSFSETLPNCGPGTSFPAQMCIGLDRNGSGVLLVNQSGTSDTYYYDFTSPVYGSTTQCNGYASSPELSVTIQWYGIGSSAYSFDYSVRAKIINFPEIGADCNVDIIIAGKMFGPFDNTSVGYTFPSVSGILPSSSSVTLANRIVELEANNNTLEEYSNATARYEQLAVGSYYSGALKLAYLGADRVWSGGRAYNSTSSEVFQIKDGFSKRSFFAFNYSMFYVYLNATLLPESPYINISIQIEYLETFVPPISYVFLQTFSASDFFPFSNASLFSSNGTLEETMPQDGGMPAPVSGGMLIAYSNQSNVFTQDAVLIKFTANNSAYDVEHWFRDGAFQGLSWLGVGYYVTTDSGDYHLVDRLSPPIYADAYPITHFDYHLLSDTVKYVATSATPDVSVAPPASFGFISYGLALDAAANPQNTTLNNLARGYWNYYYAR